MTVLVFLAHELIRQWAPIIWLAPEEKFLPLSAEEFLGHMNVAEKHSSVTENDKLLTGSDSKKYYLITKRRLDELLAEEDSFLHGKNPNEHSVPVYIIIIPCSPNLSFHTSNAVTVSTNINALVNNLEVPPHFSVVYWIFYPYNEGKEVCLIGKVPTPILFGSCVGKRKSIGNHVGDWEHLTLSFTGNSYPEKMYLAVHDTGAYYNYDPSSRLFKFQKQSTKKGILQRPKFPVAARTRNNHPILFSAKGSHGLWTAPGDHYFVKVPRLIDRNGYGISWETWKNLKIFLLGFDSLPDWMKFKGKWGNPQSNCFLFRKLGLCEVSDGPRDNEGSVSSAVSVLTQETKEAAKKETPEPNTHKSLLHRKLRECNNQMYTDMESFCHNIISQAEKNLTTIDQQLLKSQNTLQTAVTSLRSLHVNSSMIRDRLQNILSSKFLTNIK
ncbi:hypothetical protein FQA39_LY13175 [Lamprigera yunnana]|nr:hypothetical protein FQA39_LY13175 [Lamprigera yunnana]